MTNRLERQLAHDSTESTTQPRIFGLLTTYRRPADLRFMLDSLETQSLKLNALIVVDNGSQPETRNICELHRGTLNPTLIDPGKNLGPAGSQNLAIKQLDRVARDTDFVLILDDNDPPPDTEILRHLYERLLAYATLSDQVAGIALRGARLNTRTGVVETVTDTTAGTNQDLNVDHLHGGFFPLYRLKALRDVNGVDPTFFFGFEELELGRRLIAHGYRLLMAHDLYNSIYETSSTVRLRNVEPDQAWSRYHKERNLIRILKRERCYAAIIYTVLFRHLIGSLRRLGNLHQHGSPMVLLRLKAVAAGLRDEHGLSQEYDPSAPRSKEMACR